MRNLLWKEKQSRLDLRHGRKMAMYYLAMVKPNFFYVFVADRKKREGEKMCSDYECDLIQFINGCIYIYFIILTRNTHRALKRFSSWGPFFVFSIVTLKLKWEIKTGDIAIAEATHTKKMFSACFFSFTFWVCVCVSLWRENPMIREWWTFLWVQMRDSVETACASEKQTFYSPFSICVCVCGAVDI